MQTSKFWGWVSLEEEFQALSSEKLFVSSIKYAYILLDFIKPMGGLWIIVLCYGTGKAKELGTRAGPSWWPPFIPPVWLAPSLLPVISVVKLFSATSTAIAPPTPPNILSALRPPVRVQFYPTFMYRSLLLCKAG